MTDSTPEGNPDSALDGSPYGPLTGPDANTLPSTYRTSFTANGIDDVVFRFAPYSKTAVHNQMWGINGLVLKSVPEPSSIILALIGGVFGIAGLLRRRK
ncbi:MAG TPA: PEP-CTERM sorting domain-containing protein [Thermoguttaceae bacterium]|nr:PEP-CTERM sorting domain-containing protein [Thermoguttaceae bacterium]